VTVFDHSEMRQAREHSLMGGQALHIWGPPQANGQSAWPGQPACFRRSRLWGHLMDQDRERLVATARQLGVKRIVVGSDGEPNQHVDLCGRPLANAIARARRPSDKLIRVLKEMIQRKESHHEPQVQS